MLKQLVIPRIVGRRSMAGVRLLHSGSILHQIRDINGSKTEDATIKSHPILKRVPKFLLPYTKNFINAPISHVTAFLILHELTAIVPLVGFWYLFHKYHWSVPMDLPSWAIEKGTKIIDKSMESFDYTNFSLADKARFIMEGAYAYVLVKTLFPIRIMVSLGLMPLFAKYFVVPFTRMFRRKRTPKAASEALDINEAPAQVKLKKVNKPRL